MNKILIIAGLCTATISGAASAAQVGSYVGVTATMNTIKADRKHSVTDFKTKKLPGFELAYGYNLNQNLGYELSAGYIPGKHKSFKGDSLKTKISGYTVKADVIGYLPLNKTFELYAKGGPAIGRVKVKKDVSEHSYKFGYNVGAGAIAHVTKAVSLKAGYDYTGLGAYKVGQFDLGVNYNF